MRLTKHEIARRIGQFETACRSKGLPLTTEKRAIFEAVASSTGHPPARQIYAAMRQRFPRMSFATVYKNLGQFCRLGLVREIQTADGTSRYDADTSLHAHVIRPASGVMADVPLTGPLPLPDGIDAAAVDHVSLIYYLK